MSAVETVSSPARPFATPQRRDANRPIRYTVDMDREQHTFMRLFAIHNDVKAATVFRSMIYLLETRIDLATLVIDTIFREELPILKNRTTKPIRYTIDMDGSQHTFLRLFAAHNEIKASTAVRTLLYLLETRLDLATLVIETIFDDDEDDEEANEDVIEELQPED